MIAVSITILDFDSQMSPNGVKARSVRCAENVDLCAARTRGDGETEKKAHQRRKFIRFN